MAEIVAMSDRGCYPVQVAGVGEKPWPACAPGHPSLFQGTEEDRSGGSERSEMKLKSLEICGFKSFVDKAVVKFDHDVTGIVGPNGCGKSNIVDAIRWAMGEQSAKHLRGKHMDDVIFNGSEARGPHSFAEVTLVFDNTDPTGVP